MRALNAAKEAGATYADVRVGFRETLNFQAVGAGSSAGMGRITHQDAHDYGIRVLVNGVWGFSHSTEMNADTVAATAQRAVHQAKVNSRGSTSKVELAAAPVASNAEWQMKVRHDPFKVGVDEHVNLLIAGCLATLRVKGVVRVGVSVAYLKED